MNNIPEVTNLKTPQTVHLSELLAGGSVIYTLTGNDADATDVLSYSWQVDPVTDTALFQLDTTTDRTLQTHVLGVTNFFGKWKNRQIK